MRNIVQITGFGIGGMGMSVQDDGNSGNFANNGGQQGAPAEAFGIGQVLSVCLSLLGRNLGRLALIVLISQISVLAVFAIAMTPVILDIFEVIAQRGQNGQINTQLLMLSLMSRFSFAFIVVAIAGILGFAFATSACAYGSYVALESDDKVPFLGSLGKGLRRLFPAAAITFIYYVASFILVGGAAFVGMTFAFSMGAGQSSFIITGGLMFVAFIMLAWFGVRISVSIPATVVEGKGVLDGFRRSMQLTKGYGWSIFFVLLILSIGTFILALIAQFVLGLMAGPPTTGNGISTVFIIMQAVNMIVGLVMYVPILAALGVIHNRLVYLKDGASPSGVVAVFD